MMHRVVLLLILSAVMSACTTTRPTLAPLSWERRLGDLQRIAAWRLDGRAAVALGTQGWQASLNWHQDGPSSDLHLAGPFGVGALVLTKTPAGLSLDGAPPSDAVMATLQERLGFELPLDDLRFWLLGIPDPDAPFELSRNAQDRAKQLVQAGWTVDYDRYLPVNGDLLPGYLVLRRDDVHVKIAVDHWVGVE